MSFVSIFEQMGRVDGGLYLLTRLLEKASRRHLRIVKYYFFAQPIGRPGTKPMRPDAATTLVPVRAGDALAASFPRPPSVIQRRYDTGATCTAALVRGEFAGFIWLQRQRYEEDEVRCSYVLEAPDSSVWDFDVYVEPKYRVGRTMARLWSHVDAELSGQGVRWSFSRISAFNPASLASHSRLGIVKCGSAMFVLLGPLQLSLLPGSPWLHLSASQRRAPLVTLRPPS